MTLTDKVEARRRVALSARASEFPVIDDAEIEGVPAVPAIEADPDADPPIEGVEAVPATPGILDLFPVAAVWAPETRYLVGAGVVPTEANETGRWYLLVNVPSSGVTLSSATEPSWGSFGGYLGGWVDDNGLLWQDRGAAPACLWDLDSAINEVWKRKLALALSVPKSVEVDARDRFDLGNLVSDLEAAVERTQPFLVARSW